MGAAGFRTTGDVVWFPACPASYLSAFTLAMLTWYLWLNEWGKTPFDFGPLGRDELDARYGAAMIVLKQENARIEREEIERIRSKD